jgi:hypothetical protein
MARIRTIKPEFPQSESMGNVSRDARLTFIMLWTLADDEGRLRGNSRMLASLLFPYDKDAGDLIDGWLDELEKEGCVARYKADRQSYVELPNWLIHQKIDKPSKSKIPPFAESSRIVANASRRIKDQGSEDQGMEGTGTPDGTGTELVDRRSAPIDRDVIPTIFAYWQKVMHSPNSKLDAKRIELIRKALKLGYEPRQLCEAILGCSRSPHHMGQNDRNMKYNGLGLILRNAEYIDKFGELASQRTVGTETLEQRNARIMAEFLQGDDADDPSVIDMEGGDEAC